MGAVEADGQKWPTGHGPLHAAVESPTVDPKVPAGHEDWVAETDPAAQ